MVFPALLTAMLGSGLSPISGSGSTYVFANLGPWSDPDCRETNSIDFDLEAFLAGVSDEAICIDGGLDATSFADTRVELHEDGFIARVNGWGEAIGDETTDAFSRHDVNSSMELTTESDLRIHVSWFVFAAGLGNVMIDVHRLGDIGGPNDPSPPIIDRSVGSYIDPISLYGVDVLFMPAGRWRIGMYSTHQSMGTKEGFTHSFARTTHTATYVALGDVDGDGQVGVNDLLEVIGSWGPCSEPCRADLDGDGQVGVTDLLQVISDWS